MGAANSANIFLNDGGSVHTVTVHLSLSSIPSPSVVTEALRAIDSKKATDKDKLAHFFSSFLPAVISEHITHIFNLAILNGTIPTVW